MADGDAVLDLKVARNRLRRRLANMKKQKAALQKTLEEKPIADLPMWKITQVPTQTAEDKAAYDPILLYILDNEPDDDTRDKDEENAEEYQLAVAEVNDLSLLLLSMKSCHKTIQSLNTTAAKLQALYDAEPGKNYSTHLKCVKDELDKLKMLLERSPMEEKHPMRDEADKAIDTAYLILADLNKPPDTAKTDVKLAISDEDSLGAPHSLPHSSVESRKTGCPSGWSSPD